MDVKPLVYKEVTLSLDTSQYADGDVLAATQEIEDVFTAGQPLMLYSLYLLDKDDQAQGMIIYLMRSDVDVGTENSAIAITDAEADEILTEITIESGDYIDHTDWQTVRKKPSDDGMGVVLKTDAGKSLWIAVESDGTGTYTANGITLKLGFVP